MGKSGSSYIPPTEVNSADFKTYVPSEGSTISASRCTSASVGGKTTRSPYWNQVTASSACDVESQAPARSQVVAVAAAPTEKPKSCCSCWYLIIALVVFAICVVAYLVLGPKTEKKYVCPKCDSSFTTQSALATHQQQCGVTPGPKKFACAEGCHKVFQSQSALTKHYQATAHKCSVCNEMIVFGAPKTCSLMVLHEANCRGPNAPEIEWQCPKCHLVFDTVNAGHVCRKVNPKPNRT